MCAQNVPVIGLAAGSRAGLLARVTALWLVTSRRVDRSGQPAGAGMGNSGPLAARRTEVVRESRPLPWRDVA
ncbi:hypothetical protein [Streptomyces sp. NPDC101393]|uniref:hypothetical protein n=1 Tax=Streptomyces sp. NPDC101393 TaxID=3366141 RepID=UPI0038107045